MGPPCDVGKRVEALTCLDLGLSVKETANRLQVSPSAIYRWRNIATKRGYNPKEGTGIRLEYVIDAPRSGRPSKITKEIEDQIVEIITRNKTSRTLTGLEISKRLNLSERTILRVLKRLGYRKVKQTVKPGLTEEMKKARLEFALRYKDWTLEDWKSVIWSDETSVVLGQRRGGQRVWRKVSEVQDSQVRRVRWKGHSEFMFWGCFSYDKKGPFHIWKKETATQKRAAEADLRARNERIETRNREIWELETALRRVHITRNQRGRRPVWRHTEETGAYIRKKGRGGIDWYRYQKEILIPKLIPFAQRCMVNRPNTVVQEDKAPAHNSRYQDEVWNLYQVIRLLWPGNSPDLNMIEPTWFYMKRETTKLGAPTARITAERVWTRCWNNMPQSKIRRWIERIPYHIQEVIRLEGGNGYKEGVPKDTSN
jgi:transposase